MVGDGFYWLCGIKKLVVYPCGLAHVRVVVDLYLLLVVAEIFAFFDLALCAVVVSGEFTVYG